MSEQSAMVVDAVDGLAELERLAEAAELAARAQRYAAQSMAERTRSEYSKQWRLFEAWCSTRGREALPCTPDTLIAWLVGRAGAVSVSTLALGMAALCYKHVEAGVVFPRRDAQVAAVWSGVRRAHGRAARRAAPLIAAEVRQVCAALPCTRVGARDRLVITLGMAAALRRSELVALEVEDVERVAGGLRVLVKRSKTDQEGIGARVGVAMGSDPSSCPVRALEAWLEASGVTSGPLLRPVVRDVVLERPLPAAAVNTIVKRAARAVGLESKRYSGHSLRAGLATSAAVMGKTDRSIMAQGRWRGRSMVDRYVRDARLLDSDNASHDIGL